MCTDLPLLSFLYRNFASGPLQCQCTFFPATCRNLSISRGLLPVALSWERPLSSSADIQLSRGVPRNTIVSWPEPLVLFIGFCVEDMRVDLSSPAFFAGTWCTWLWEAFPFSSGQGAYRALNTCIGSSGAWAGGALTFDSILQIPAEHSVGVRLLLWCASCVVPLCRSVFALLSLCLWGLLLRCMPGRATPLGKLILSPSCGHSPLVLLSLGRVGTATGALSWQSKPKLIPFRRCAFPRKCTPHFLLYMLCFSSMPFRVWAIPEGFADWHSAVEDVISARSDDRGSLWPDTLPEAANAPVHQLNRTDDAWPYLVAQMQTEASLEAYGETIESPRVRVTVLVPSRAPLLYGFLTVGAGVEGIRGEVERRVAASLRVEYGIMLVDPPPCSGVLTMLAVPPWVSPSLRETVVFDLTAIGGPLFAEHIWGHLYVREVSRLAKRFSTAWDVFLPGDSFPWVGNGPHRVVSGQTVKVVPPGHRPNWGMVPEDPPWSIWLRADPPRTPEQSERLWLVAQEDYCWLLRFDGPFGDQLKSIIADRIGRDVALTEVCALLDQDFLRDLRFEGVAVQGVVAVAPRHDGWTASATSSGLCILDAIDIGRGLRGVDTRTFNSDVSYAQRLIDPKPPEGYTSVITQRQTDSSAILGVSCQVFHVDIVSLPSADEEQPVAFAEVTSSVDTAGVSVGGVDCLALDRVPAQGERPPDGASATDAQPDLCPAVDAQGVRKSSFDRVHGARPESAVSDHAREEQQVSSEVADEVRLGIYASAVASMHEAVPVNHDPAETANARSGKAWFLLFAPDRVPEEVRITVDPPIHLEDVRQNIENERLDGNKVRFGHVVPVHPQPSHEFGSLLCLPDWAVNQVTILVDCRSYDVRLFCMRVDPWMQWGSFALHAHLPQGENFDLIVRGLIHPRGRPLMFSQGDLVVVQDVGGPLPPFLNLSDLLLSCESFEAEAPQPVSPSFSNFLVLNDGGPRGIVADYNVINSSFGFQEYAAEILQLQQHRASLKCSKPRIEDALHRGVRCRAVVLVTECLPNIPVPPARSTVKLTVAFLDLRPILRGFDWRILVEGEN